jgi:hypothetical protein
MFDLAMLAAFGAAAFLVAWVVSVLVGLAERLAAIGELMRRRCRAA